MLLTSPLSHPCPLHGAFHGYRKKPRHSNTLVPENGAPAPLRMAESRLRNSKVHCWAKNRCCRMHGNIAELACTRGKCSPFLSVLLPSACFTSLHWLLPSTNELQKVCLGNPNIEKLFSFCAAGLGSLSAPKLKLGCSEESKG